MILLNTSTGLSVWDLVIKGGWLMIPIFLLSVAGIYIICERWFLIRKIEKRDRFFLKKIDKLLEAKNDKGALNECLLHDSPLSRMLYKGIKYKKIPMAELRSMMENSASESIASIEKGFTTLANVSSLAPMIGFLGTVIGMVQAFYDMSLAGNNINITLLSRGIYTAMVTTVAGLIVGIIALFGYNMLVSRVDKITNRLDRACEKFIESLY
ncbi:MotA/TolQ/ExbB proton channel family protein [Odoribacter sp. OttesenSCG-928-A06]|nr:MotA/TolQ/ExbB proton channel family protein [Odoribacter sp. OttesenSCG-928-A06]